MISSFYFSRNKIGSYLILVGVFVTITSSNYVSRQTVLDNLVFPSGIDVVVGEEIYFKITKPLADQKDCHYQRAGERPVDIKRSNRQKIESWDVCGVRIKNVSDKDHGFWKLTSQNKAKNNVTGITFINVRNMDFQPPVNDIKTIDKNISPKQTVYCYVLRPDQTKTEFPRHESCVFPKFSDELEGNGVWNIVAGVKGKVEEISYKINVQKNVEQLVTSVVHNAETSTLRMKCKLIHSGKMMKFCRFLRINDDVGYNLEDGRGEGRYRYDGDGFKNNECGISITNPDDSDKSPWKCFIGFDDDETIGAIIDGGDPQRTNDEIDASDVYGLENTAVNMLCKRYTPTDYCWFRDPSGRKILVSDQQIHKKTDNYRYYGTGIKMGECGLTILNATHSHSGTWSCHLGSTQTARTDTFQEISVRIAESPFVSTNLFQDAQQDTPLILECRSIPEHVPVDYCRFVMPDGTGFSINEKTTAKNLYMNNYYFNPNRKMESGYCSIIVKNVDRKKHQGQWMCISRLSGHKQESSDEFRVTVYDSNVSVASLTGLLFAIIIVICGGVFFTYQKRYRIQSPRSVISYIAENDNVSIRSNNSNNSQSSSQANENIELRTVR